MSDEKRNEHTPGPWSQVIADQIGPWKIVNTEGKSVLESPMGHNDAALIASAPEMYALLICLKDDEGLSAKNKERIDYMLNKAKGRQK